MELVSPVSVVVISTALTVAGWAVWDMGWEKREAARQRAVALFRDSGYDGAASSNTDSASVTGSSSPVKSLDLSTNERKVPTSSEGSYFPPFDGGAPPIPESPEIVTKSSGHSSGDGSNQYQDHSKQLRRDRVLATAKSALLIYCNDRLVLCKVSNYVLTRWPLAQLLCLGCPQS
jgi:phosphatidylinositol glycan class C protein